MKIKKYKLFESPDEPLSSDEIKMTEKHYKSKDAITFSYISNDNLDTYFNMAKLNKDKTIFNLKIKNLKLSPDFDYLNDLDKIEYMKDGWQNRSYFMFPSYMGNSHIHGDIGDRGEDKYAGRLWYKEKYISFWEYPTDYDELIRTLKHIEGTYNRIYKKKINILNDLDNWFIEVLDEDSQSVFEPTKNIKIKDYMGGDQTWSDEIMKSPHLENPKKRKEMLKGYKSKTSKWKKYMKPFENFKKK